MHVTLIYCQSEYALHLNGNTDRFCPPRDKLECQLIYLTEHCTIPRKGFKKPNVNKQIETFENTVTLPYYTRASLQLVTEEPRFTDTRLIQTLHYYGQFALSLVKEGPYIFSKFNPLNTDTPLIRTFSMAPSVSVLTGFDCNMINRH